MASVGALALASWAGAAEPQVTLAVRLVKLPNYEPTHVFSGHVGRVAAGELVTVLAAVCPRTFETSVAGASPLAGGFWEASAVAPNTAVTYRARWEGRFSAPVKIWSAMAVEATKAGPHSVVVRIDTTEAFQNLSRKVVQLQRLDRATGRWSPYLAARLKWDASEGAFKFSTRFTGVGRDLTVRVRVPAQTAAPCFRPRVTSPIRM